MLVRFRHISSNRPPPVSGRSVESMRCGSAECFVYIKRRPAFQNWTSIYLENYWTLLNDIILYSSGEPFCTFYLIFSAFLSSALKRVWGLRFNVMIHLLSCFRATFDARWMHFTRLIFRITNGSARGREVLSHYSTLLNKLTKRAENEQDRCWNVTSSLCVAVRPAQFLPLHRQPSRLLRLSHLLSACWASSNLATSDGQTCTLGVSSPQDCQKSSVKSPSWLALQALRKLTRRRGWGGPCCNTFFTVSQKKTVPVSSASGHFIQWEYEEQQRRAK